MSYAEACAAAHGDKKEWAFKYNPFWENYRIKNRKNLWDFLIKKPIFLFFTYFGWEKTFTNIKKYAFYLHFSFQK